MEDKRQGMLRMMKMRKEDKVEEEIDAWGGGKTVRHSQKETHG